MKIAYRVGLFFYPFSMTVLNVQNLVQLKVMERYHNPDRELQLGLCSLFKPIDMTGELRRLEIYENIEFGKVDDAVRVTQATVGDFRILQAQEILAAVLNEQDRVKYSVVRGAAYSRKDLLSSLKELIC